MTIPAGSRTFHDGALGYAATIARTLTPVAQRVVARARLAPGEMVIDVGSGTGTAAAAAVGEGRTVVGIDGAPGMIEIARGRVPGASFTVMDFGRLDFADATFDAVVSSHALHFADDREAALREWRRVTRPNGRLSLSVPGPPELTPGALYREAYDRHGIDGSGRYATEAQLRELVAAAGWWLIETAADPRLEIRLETEALFRSWRRIGSAADATRDWTRDEHEAFTRELLEMTPRDADGAYRIPFGAIFLTARRTDG